MGREAPGLPQEACQASKLASQEAIMDIYMAFPVHQALRLSPPV